jgi:hypothetical protein
LTRDAPEAALPALFDAQAALAALPDVPRVRDARADLAPIVAGAAGLFVRANALQPAVVPGWYGGGEGRDRAAPSGRRSCCARSSFPARRRRSPKR